MTAEIVAVNSQTAPDRSAPATRCALHSLRSLQCLLRRGSPSGRPLSFHPDKGHTPPQPIALLVVRFAPRLPSVTVPLRGLFSVDLASLTPAMLIPRGGTAHGGAVARALRLAGSAVQRATRGRAGLPSSWWMKGEGRSRSYSRLSRHYSSEARISCSATANDPRASSLVCESNRSADLLK